MTTTYTYQRRQELPGISFPWLDANGDPVNLSTGYVVKLTLFDANGVVALTKTITGTNGAANVDWSADDLDIAEGYYRMLVVATDDLGNDRVYSPGNLPQLVIAGPGVPVVEV